MLLCKGLKWTSPKRELWNLQKLVGSIVMDFIEGILYQEEVEVFYFIAPFQNVTMISSCPPYTDLYLMSKINLLPSLSEINILMRLNIFLERQIWCKSLFIKKWIFLFQIKNNSRIIMGDLFWRFFGML